MSLAVALGQLLHDVLKGRKVLIASCNSRDQAITIKVLTGILNSSGCCNSVEATHSQCVARLKPACFAELSALLLKEYQKAARHARTVKSQSISQYIQQHPEAPESDCLLKLLTDTSGSYILEVFSSVFQHNLSHPDAPPGYTHVVLTDNEGGYLGLLFTTDEQSASSSLASFQASKSSAAACMRDFRETHPASAVVMAGVYHDQFKLNLLEDSQPEALTLIQSLQHVQSSRSSRSSPASSCKSNQQDAVCSNPLLNFWDDSKQLPGSCQQQAQPVTPVLATVAVAGVAAAAAFGIGRVVLRALNNSGNDG